MSVTTAVKFSKTDTPKLRSYCFPEDPAAVQFCGSRNWVHMWSTAVNSYTWGSSWNQNSNTLEPKRPQHDGPIAYVIAQQYSSATFISLYFYSNNKNFGTSSKNCIYFCLFHFLKKSLWSERVRLFLNCWDSYCICSCCISNGVNISCPGGKGFCLWTDSYLFVSTHAIARVIHIRKYRVIHHLWTLLQEVIS